MTQRDYMKALLMNLKGIDDEYRTEILENINEHFEVGLSKGKTEDEIAKALGDPRTQARLFILEQSIVNIKERRNARNYFHVVSCFLSLGTSGLLSGIAALFTLSFWLIFAMTGVIVVVSGIILLVSAGFGAASEKPLITALSVFIAIGISSLGALVSIWMFNASKPITAVFFKLAGNLRSRYGLLKSEVG